MISLPCLSELPPRRFENPATLRRLTTASRALAELKGVAATIPNQDILISTLGLQEAKDSSAIENIVTTHDELFRDALFPATLARSAAKEVLRYRQALRVGHELVSVHGLLLTSHLLRIQAELELNNAGLRRLPGTTLKNSAGETVYTPPQEHDQIVLLMADLERFINDDGLFDADPLVKMALIHYQFESIHPFYDGNGRTGRILNVLYLVRQGLLENPVLNLSRAIVRRKADYYRLLQAVREGDAWEEWVDFMLAAVEESATDAIATIGQIKAALHDAKHRIRAGFRFYSQDLINNLFTHPYTKIDFLMRDLGVSRLTATRYLDALSAEGFLEKQRVGRANYYINRRLCDIIAGGEGKASARQCLAPVALRAGSSSPMRMPGRQPSSAGSMPFQATTRYLSIGLFYRCGTPLQGKHLLVGYIHHDMLLGESMNHLPKPHHE